MLKSIVHGLAFGVILWAFIGLVIWILTDSFKIIRGARRMNDYRLRFTKHAYRRYRQRVGNLPLRILAARCQTAINCGLYRYGEGLIKLNGIWWGCVVEGQKIVLITCYGKQTEDMIRQRREGYAK